jgi:broad specificity phosphatase PhoE
MPERLILVKHSLPAILPDVPAREWVLSEEGQRRSMALAEVLRPYQPIKLIASEEPKAAETGQIAAVQLGCRFETRPGLHEHVRVNEPYRAKAEFEALVQRFFQQPARLVFGEETADEAEARFTWAVEAVIEQNEALETLVIVAHGTVITLYVSCLTGIAPFPLWQRLGLPGFVVLNGQQKTVISIMDEVV